MSQHHQSKGGRQLGLFAAEPAPSSRPVLIVGPAGSGKTHEVLARLREKTRAALAAGKSPRATLVTPTASSAQHLLHQTARSGFALPSDSVLPLSSFASRFAPQCPEPPGVAEVLLLEKALDLAGGFEFAAVSHYSGFHAGFLGTMKEFWSAGASGASLSTLLGRGPKDQRAQAFAQVMIEYERLLAGAGSFHPAQRLRQAAAAVKREKTGYVFFDGFVNFTPVEMELVLAVAASAEACVVTLPDQGAEEARQELLDAGFTETALQSRWRPAVEAIVIEASSPELEVQDVACRILTDHAQTRRPFSEYGLILRQPQAYAARIAVVFERFGIPFRLRQAEPLLRQSNARYLAGLLQLADGGLEAGQALQVLKHAASGLGLEPELDEFEFRLRERLPGQGLEFLHRHAGGLRRIQKWLGRLAALEGWTKDKIAPALWAERCELLLREWCALPPISDEIAHSAVLEYRASAEALEAWRQAAADAAAALQSCGLREVSLAGYRKALDLALTLTPLRTPDRRRNVVQVLSVYEARQWELPVVFICGLVERQFPGYHGQNLFFPDHKREHLSRLGVRLRTTADLEREERLLFELAHSRATSQLYLTYPKRDAAGGELVPSFFLPNAAPAAAQQARLRRTAPAWADSPSRLNDPSLLQAVAERHAAFSPSALALYAQCPFQFFSDRTLRLRGRAASPEDRLDDLLRGQIVHETLAAWTPGKAGSAQQPIWQVFEEVFARVCEQKAVPPGFHREAVRLELRADLERFEAELGSLFFRGGFQAGEPEIKMEYLIEPPGQASFRIRGRIDCCQVRGDQAVVVDYKYSGGANIKKTFDANQNGNRLQAGLYLRGVEQQLHLKPLGMFFLGLRGEIVCQGWRVPGIAGEFPELEELTDHNFHLFIERTAGAASRIVRDIRAGSTAVQPQELQYCRDRCSYREVCRIKL